MESNPLIVYANYDGYSQYEENVECEYFLYDRTLGNNLRVEDSINIDSWTIYHNIFMDFSIDLPHLTVPYKVELVLTCFYANPAAQIIIGKMPNPAQSYADVVFDEVLFGETNRVRTDNAYQYTPIIPIASALPYTFDLGPLAVADLARQKTWFSIAAINESGENGGIIEFFQTSWPVVSERPFLRVYHSRRRRYGS